MKIVLDANVVVAAFASRGLCESIMELCLSEHKIMLCHDLLDEILRNLRKKIKLPSRTADDISKLLQEHAQMFNPVPLAADACRDPDDIKILGLAIAANADYIVTGDKDLLVLKYIQNIPLLNPRPFSNLLRNKKK